MPSRRNPPATQRLLHARSRRQLVPNSSSLFSRKSELASWFPVINRAFRSDSSNAIPARIASVTSHRPISMRSSRELRNKRRHKCRIVLEHEPRAALASLPSRIAGGGAARLPHR